MIEKVTTRKRPRQTQINVAKYSKEEAVAVLKKKRDEQLVNTLKRISYHDQQKLQKMAELEKIKKDILDIRNAHKVTEPEVRVKQKLSPE